MKPFLPITLLCIVGLLIPNLSRAAECAATYPDGLTNSTSSGTIKFQNSGRLINNPDTVLATTSVQNNGYATNLYIGQLFGRRHPGSPINRFFTSHSTSTDLNVNGYTTTVSNNDYDEIRVRNGGRLTFGSGFSTYTIDSLKVESYSTVYMAPGTYYINSLEVKGTSTLSVTGSGTVKILCPQKSKIPRRLNH